MTATAEPKPTLRIGEVAEQVGVNSKTIRYYEEIGLVPQPARRPNGYRVYHTEDVERISFIRRAQRFGLSLEEIREVLAHREEGTSPCDFVLAAVCRHADEVEARIADLTRLREELDELIARARSNSRAPARYCHLLEPANGEAAPTPHGHLDR